MHLHHSTPKLPCRRARCGKMLVSPPHRQIPRRSEVLMRSNIFPRLDSLRPLTFFSLPHHTTKVTVSLWIPDAILNPDTLLYTSDLPRANSRVVLIDLRSMALVTRHNREGADSVATGTENRIAQVQSNGEAIGLGPHATSVVLFFGTLQSESRKALYRSCQSHPAFYSYLWLIGLHGWLLTPGSKSFKQATCALRVDSVKAWQRTPPSNCTRSTVLVMAPARRG